MAQQMKATSKRPKDRERDRIPAKRTKGEKKAGVACQQVKGQAGQEAELNPPRSQDEGGHSSCGLEEEAEGGQKGHNSNNDKVKQVIFFCKGRNLKEEVMEMEGWRELDWGKLVKEMKPAPRYTIQELWTAVDGDYKEFSNFFDTRLKYLEKEGTFRNEDEDAISSGGSFQGSGSSRGRRWWNRSGGYSLPTLKELNLAVDAEMKFKGRSREELNKKRE
ncbi:hypothetical protein BY996DRAFT_6474355, partial [Phakopsora pachyrhizi]